MKHIGPKMMPRESLFPLPNRNAAIVHMMPQIIISADGAIFFPSIHPIYAAAAVSIHCTFDRQSECHCSKTQNATSGVCTCQYPPFRKYFLPPCPAASGRRALLTCHIAYQSPVIVPPNHPDPDAIEPSATPRARCWRPLRP